jgi:hypothetical protein
MMAIQRNATYERIAECKASDKEETQPLGLDHFEWRGETTLVPVDGWTSGKFKKIISIISLLITDFFV